MSTSPSALDQARRLLAASAGRTTAVRLAVLSMLIDNDHPLSHAEAHRLHPELDRVSLYRALDWLTDAGLAHRLTDADGVKRYARTGADGSATSGAQTPALHSHPHFHCSRCGRTACLDGPAWAAPALPTGFTATGVEVLVRGLCAECGKKKKKS